MPEMKRAALLLSLAVISCGGRIAEEPTALEPDAAIEKAEGADSSARGVAPTADAAPAPAADASTPPPDPPLPPATDGGVVTCTDGPATGSPMGCGPARACNAGETVTDAWAQDLLSCFVDRCAVETTGKPWCGTIGLKFGADGCTADYTESGPGAGTCVKYQGYYRAWPCLAGRSITVTRPCP